MCASRSAKRQRRGVRVARLAHRVGDHAGAAGEVRRRVDQDEAAGAAVLGVAIEHERPRGRDLDGADLVEHQRVVDFGRDRPRAVLQQVDAARIERPLVHPDDFGLELLSDERRLDASARRRG